MLVLSFASGAKAGTNAGGVLLLHANPTLAYTTTSTYCAEAPPSGCEAVLTRVDAMGPTMVFVLAAFHPDAAPRLRGASFGLSYPPDLEIVGWGDCADFELCQCDFGWPGSGWGTSITFNEARTEQVIPLYWLAVEWQTEEPALLQIVPAHRSALELADDSVPAKLDAPLGVGSVGFGMDGSAPCPVSLESVGACCTDDGHCRRVTASDCASGGGDFLGDPTECDPNPCPEAIGACCGHDGSCSILSAEACTQVGAAVWLGPAQPCEPSACPAPWVVGACCLTDGSCVLRTVWSCRGEAGLYEGDDTVCAPETCGPADFVACCLWDGRCSLLPPTECFRRGGHANPEGECDPNPCNANVFGACCLFSGGCTQITEAECLGDAESPGVGEFAGRWTHCDPDPCWLPQDVGGCCQRDGTCVELTARFCICSGDVFLGGGISCALDRCESAEVGACCMSTNKCVVLVETVCVSLGGRYLGDEVGCTIDNCSTGGPQVALGACCLAGQCESISQTECVTRGGLYVGDGTSCEASTCGPATPVARLSWGAVKGRYR